MKTAFRIHESDNVATLLADVAERDIQVRGAGARDAFHCLDTVKLGHKVATADIARNSPVIKDGVVIGIASESIYAANGFICITAEVSWMSARAHWIYIPVHLRT